MDIVVKQIFFVRPRGCRRFGIFVRVGTGGFLPVGAGFFTGMALGNGQYLVLRFLEGESQPIFHLHDIIFSLKLSISTFPSSKRSPFCNQTPWFLTLSKIEKYHCPSNLKKPRSSKFVLRGLGGGGGGAGLITEGGRALWEPGRRNGFA